MAKTLVAYFSASGLGPAGDNMQKLAPGSKVAAGKRFAASVSSGELADWAESFK